MRRKIKQEYNLTVEDKRGFTWMYQVWVEPRFAREAQKAGILIERAVNRVPEWWADLGLSTDAWCFLEDIFKMRNPFRKD